MAFQKALENHLPAVAYEYEQQGLRLLVGLCRELQRAAGPGNSFFLASRTAERLLNVDHSTISRWLRGLQVDQVLLLTEQGGQKTKKANRYRYLPDDLQKSS